MGVLAHISALTYQPVNQSINLSIYLAINQLTYLSIDLSIYHFYHES